MIRNKMIKSALFSTLCLTLMLASCDPSKKFAQAEQDEIQKYLSSNSNLAFEKKASGLYFLEIQPGTGELAATHDTAYVKYTGKFLDGTVFDSNVTLTKTLNFAINEGYLIAGFDEGITYMKPGGKAMMLIPSSLGYGAGGYYGIAGYTPLLFDVELVSVKPGVAK